VQNSVIKGKEIKIVAYWTRGRKGGTKAPS